MARLVLVKILNNMVFLAKSNDFLVMSDLYMPTVILHPCNYLLHKNTIAICKVEETHNF